MRSPSFDSSLLRTVAEGFERRGKALRYQTKALTVTRETDIKPPELERLNVDATTVEAKATQVRLSVWPDGVLWFRACQPSKAGWNFLFAFHGQLKTPLSEDLTALFEESLTLVHGASRQPGCEQKLLSLWRTVSPVISNDA